MQVVRHEVPVLVDGAVAIVVDLVAALCCRHAAGLRNDPGAVRVLAELPGGAGLVAGSAMGVVRQQVESVVDDPVAVVVRVVAGLGSGSAARRRRRPLALAAVAELSCRADPATDAAVELVGRQIEVLIDGAVAVVIDVVAQLCHRCAAVHRGVPGAVSVPAALVGSAGRTALTAVALVDRQVEAVVDQLITIVVGVVAGLRGRYAGGNRHDPGACPVGAVLPGRAGVPAVAAVDLVEEQVIPLVDEAVAVVVGVVAHLRRRRSAGGDGDQPTAVAVLADLSRSADVAAGAAVLGIGEQGDSLVDQTITVVVRVVADFDCRYAPVLWHVPGAGAVLAVLVGRAGPSALAAIEGVVLQVKALVDQLVAVVVDVVADLRDCYAAVLGYVPDALACLAGLTGRANPAAGAAVGRIGGEVDALVDQAVAVVVDVVAHLIGRHADVDGRLPGAVAVEAVLSGGADKSAESAVERVVGQVVAVVQNPIAVVVDAVARLRGRRAAGGWGDPGTVTVVTDLVGSAGVAADATVGFVVGEHEAVVDGAVTVVVDTVAELVGWRAARGRHDPGAGT